MDKLLNGLITALIIGAVSWLFLTTLENSKSLKLIEYKLDQNNMILQNLYESKKDK